MPNFRRHSVIAVTGLVLCVPLCGCDRTESHEKTTTTKTTATPEGTKRTTETTERKVETQPK